MATLKTQATDASVAAYLAAIEDLARRADCEALCALMRKASGSQPRMWGSNMVGFGQYHYKYESGREGDWFALGFSSRKAEISVYLMTGFEPRPELLAQLGKHKMGKSCLNIKRLADVDSNVLEQLLKDSLAATRAQYPS